MKTFIFYHLYITDTPVWQDILKVQFDSIVNSGLYDELKTIYFGVVYNNESDLLRLNEFAKRFDKIKIIYTRQIESFPIKIWSNPNTEIKTQLGEGETILKMIEFAKQNPSDNYLFMHSKGSTKPNPWCRSQMNHFEDRGIKKEKKYNRGVRDRTNDLILKDITTEIVTNWKEKIKILENNDFYYYIFKKFSDWINEKTKTDKDDVSAAANDYLKTLGFVSVAYAWIKVLDVSFKDYNENGCFPHEYTIKDRHWSAMFPVNLYGVVNNLDLSIKSQKTMF